MKHIEYLKWMVILLSVGLIILLVRTQNYAALLVFLLIILIIYWIYRGLIKETEDIFLEATHYIESIISSSKINRLQFYTDDLIAKFYHQLNRLAEIKQQNLQQVEEDYQRLSDSLTEIAHQLRTPLATLIAYTELLSKESLSIQAKEYYLRIKQSTEKITALVEKFILASRLEQRIIHIQKQLQPLEPTIAKAIFQIYPQAKEKGVEVALEIDSGLKVMHDSIWLEECIYNLLENSVKYNEMGSKIIVRVTDNELYTQIAVVDSGKGVEESAITQITQRYVRGENAVNHEGYGLGLYLSKEIIHLHDGFMRIKNLSPGFEVSLFLPKL